VRCIGPSIRYCRNRSTASTVLDCTDDHCRVICQVTSHRRPPTIATVPTTAMTIASQRGTRWRSIQVNAGQRRAVMRMATSSGITSSFSWITSQMATPIAAATTRKRHAYAVAMRSPCGMVPASSVETTLLRSRRASNSEPRGFSSDPLISPV
jgi:hypothetical protein